MSKLFLFINLILFEKKSWEATLTFDVCLSDSHMAINFVYHALIMIIGMKVKE